MATRTSLDAIEKKEFVPGFHGQMLHTESMTLAYWSIEKNAAIPQHDHLHEQVVNMLEGEFELVVDGTPHHLRPGDIVVIPPHVPHGGKAITDCRILDVFQPTRDDYR